MARHRDRWRVWQRDMDGGRFVFMDETSASTNMARLRGWGPRGERLLDATPHGHWGTTTFVAGLKADGIVAPFVLDGPMTGDVFRAYMEQMLAPALQPGDVVVLDNLAAHKVAGVAEAIQYVLAVRSNHHLRFLNGRGLIQTDPATMADGLPPEAWAAHAAGEGAKGLRLYDWARIALPWIRPDGFERFLLIRRSWREPQRRAYYLVFCPAGTTLAELAGAAGLRWTIEECFQRAKDDLGLDHCEARSWHGWHRHMSLVMAAAAFLARLAADLRRATWESHQPDLAASGKANERRPTPPAA